MIIVITGLKATHINFFSKIVKTHVPIRGHRNPFMRLLYNMYINIMYIIYYIHHVLCRSMTTRYTGSFFFFFHNFSRGQKRLGSRSEINIALRKLLFTKSSTHLLISFMAITVICLLRQDVKAKLVADEISRPRCMVVYIVCIYQFFMRLVLIRYCLNSPGNHAKLKAKRFYRLLMRKLFWYHKATKTILSSSQ